MASDSPYYLITHCQGGNFSWKRNIRKNLFHMHCTCHIMNWILKTPPTHDCVQSAICDMSSEVQTSIWDHSNHNEQKRIICKHEHSFIFPPFVWFNVLLNGVVALLDPSIWCLWYIVTWLVMSMHTHTGRLRDGAAESGRRAHHMPPYQPGSAGTSRRLTDQEASMLLYSIRLLVHSVWSHSGKCFGTMGGASH